MTSTPGDRPSPFSAGDRICYRGVDQGRLVDVKPVTVVEDSARWCALWLPLGTPTMRPVLRDHSPGTPRRWVEGGWQLVDSVWRWAELLILIRPEARRATWVMWSPDRSFRGWYVNLQSPLIRTPLGFDHTDHQLDIVVSPDRTWRWKDEDELGLAVATARISSEQASAIRAEGQLAVRDIECNASPFSDGWEHWTADASLARPMLVPSWDDMSMYVDGEGPPPEPG